jgi:hypothetical protein
MSEAPASKDEPGIVLGVLLIGLFVALVIALLVEFVAASPSPHYIQPGAETVAFALCFMYVGLIALLSCYFDHKTFLFRWLNSSPREFGRKAAFFNAVAWSGIGSVLFFIGIGWL